MIPLTPLTQTLIALLIVLTILTLRQLQPRKHWKKIRQTQNQNLNHTPAELAEKHPNELRDMLTNARAVQTINRAYLEDSRIREQDSTRAQELQDTTERQIKQLRVAIVESVEKRGSQGVVTPSHI